MVFRRAEMTAPDLRWFCWLFSRSRRGPSPNPRDHRGRHPGFVPGRRAGGEGHRAQPRRAKNLANYGGDAPSGFAREVIYGTAVNDRFHLDAVRGNVAGTGRHRFLLSGLYELPFARNRRFLGGWQISSVALWQTGPFLTPTFSAGLVDPANINTFNRGSILRPNRIGDGNVADPTPDHYFDIGAFAAPPANAGRIGNAGVGILTGPGTLAISGGLAKAFALGARARLRFETTFTNLPNHPNFAPPAADVSTPATFGRTTSVQTAEGAGNRVGQVSLRLEFLSRPVAFLTAGQRFLTRS